MIRSLISLCVAVALAVFAIPWCAHLLTDVWLTRIWQAPQPWPEHPLAAGIGAGLGVALMLWRKPNWLIHTTFHELCHALACWSLWVGVRGFATSDGRGGKVEYNQCDPFRDTIIAIAPYTLPLLLIPALVAHRLVPSDSQWEAVATGVVAFTWFNHLQGLFHNVRLNFWGGEGDLAKVGRPLSLVLIAGVLMLTTALTIHELWIV